jgi:hypothetical protein
VDFESAASASSAIPALQINPLEIPQSPTKYQHFFTNTVTPASLQLGSNKRPQLPSSIA